MKDRALFHGDYLDVGIASCILPVFSSFKQKLLVYKKEGWYVSMFWAAHFICPLHLGFILKQKDLYFPKWIY